MSKTKSPKRIQMSRQHPWRADNPDAIRVDRSTKYGNPWRVGEVLDFTAHTGTILTVTPELSVALFRAHAMEHFDLKELQAELGGHDLACWCGLQACCHADVLLDLANPTNFVVNPSATRSAVGFATGGYFAPPGAGAGASRSIHMAMPAPIAGLGPADIARVAMAERQVR